MTVSWCLLLFLFPVLRAQETFFEGDLLFQDTVLAQQSPELFVKGSHFRWPGGKVPYAFEKLSSFSPAEKEVVRRSMDDIQDRTGCVEFVETDIARGGDIVLITKLGFGTQSGKGKCWAQLGRKGGTQAINLGADGCFNTGTVTHELLHTLGVIHEHTRFDRDENVEIISSNVKPENMHNFNIRTWKETEHSDTAYDYNSVMHYGIYAFSNNPDDPSIQTIKPHHEGFEGIGQSDFMSGIDAIEVALAYGCALKPETVVEFINNNVEILKTVQNKHTDQIKGLMGDIQRLDRNLQVVWENKAVFKLHSDSQFDYYKIPVDSGVRMVEGATSTACRKYGMEAACRGPSGSIYNDETKCQVVPIETGYTNMIMWGLSQAVCARVGWDARYCAELQGVFQYYKGRRGSDQGVVGGRWVLDGKQHTSGNGGKILFAYCVKAQ